MTSVPRIAQELSKADKMFIDGRHQAALQIGYDLLKDKREADDLSGPGGVGGAERSQLMDTTPAEEIAGLKPKVSNRPDYGFKFPETDNPFTAYPAVMVSWRNPVTGETASYTAGMEPPAGSPWEEGSYTPEEQNQIKKDINLTPAEIEETIVPPVAAPFQPIVPPVAAPTIPTIPNLPSLELPQMVPPVQEGIASLAPQPMVPAPQPFIPAPAPTNTGYNFQELLNMYKNPYA